jgi:cystathionine beta-lyase
VYVVSDEIWSDIILFGGRHIPTQTISEDAKNRTIAMYATTKTFNLAGLVGAYHVIYNDRLRDRVNKEASLSHYNSMNVLSMHALIGAYRPQGEEWLDELLQVLSDNADYAYRYITEHFEGVEVARPQGTYMLFLDCTAWLTKHKMSLEQLLQAGWDDRQRVHTARGLQLFEGVQFERPWKKALPPWICPCQIASEGCLLHYDR